MGVGQEVAPAELKPWIAAARGVEAWRGASEREQRERQYKEALGRAEKARSVPGRTASEEDLMVLSRGMPPTPGQQAEASVGNYMGALRVAQAKRQQALQNALKAGITQPGTMIPASSRYSGPLRPLPGMLPAGGSGLGGELQGTQLEQLLRLLMLSGWRGQGR